MINPLSYIKKIRSKVSVSTSRHPILSAMIKLVVINLVLVLAFAALLALLIPQLYPSYWSACLAAGGRIMFPSSILTLTNVYDIIIGVILAIAGMVIFSGTIIAITTNYLRQYISDKTSGRGKLPLHNHIVILNYNSQVLAILTDFMHEHREEVVIILSNKTKEYISEQLKGELESLKEKPSVKLDLIIRTGDPQSLAELNEINIKGAKSILVMDDECSSATKGNVTASDFDTIKIVLKLASCEVPSSCPIAVEAESYETVEAIHGLNQTVKGLKDNKIEVFSYDRKLGQFLAITALNPSMCNVLYELLSYSGSMLYPIDAISVEKYLTEYSAGVPVIELEKTYVLAESEKAALTKRVKPYCETRKLEIYKDEIIEKPVNLFIIGQNKKRKYLLEMLGKEDREVNIQLFESEKVDKFTEALAHSPADAENIAMILSEDDASPESRDENVFLALIEINRKFGATNRPFKIIAELLDPKNQEIISQLNIQNIIVSSRIISFFATKLLLDVNADQFYEEIFAHSLAGKHSHFSICVNEVKDVILGAENISFDSPAELIGSVYYSSERKIMPLGVIRHDKDVFFSGNLDNKTTITLQPADKLIYVKYK